MPHNISGITTSQGTLQTCFVNYRKFIQKVVINFESSELLELLEHVELFFNAWLVMKVGKTRWGTVTHSPI